MSTGTWSEETLRRLAWATFGAAVLGWLASFALDAASGHSTDQVFAAIIFTFPVMGLLVLTRRPRNVLGWLMLAMGAAFALPFESYGAYAVSAEGRGPFGPLILAISAPMWVPFIGISGFLLMLFPDGHLPTPRWRWFAWTCGLGLVGVFLLILVSPGSVDVLGIEGVENPIGIEALDALGEGIFVFVIFAPLTIVGGAVAVIRRLRRTNDPIVRQQLRWLAWSAAVMAVTYVGAFLPQVIFQAGDESAWESWLGTIAVTSFVLIPICTGIAILRYRLYDIDVVIRKTVVLTVVVAAIALVYVGVVVGVGAIVGSAGSPVLSALAAAVVALVIQPVRARARRLADHVVYGARATPYEVLATYGDQLAGTYASDDVLPRTARILAEGLGATRARVWLRVGDQDRIVASWPPDAAVDGDDEHTREVRHGGEVLGALSLTMPVNDPLDPTRERLFDDLAAQAGILLRNVRLTEDLRGRLEDLRAAQKRLVTAQDAERRRLERDIHDGAQQQLVALQVQQRLAVQLLDRDPAKARDLLGQLQERTGEALEDLRDLARGIYPPLLADKGLAAALEAQARKAAVPVTVEADPDLPRLPREAESAVYFSILEAVQNVAKYAEARSAVVRVEHHDHAVSFSVTDDGRGFDPAATGYGTGLQGIADRLGALDGSLDVRSAPGRGTTIIGAIPAEGLHPTVADATVGSSA